MATLIEKPTIIHAAGQPPKSIEEFVGQVNSSTTAVSIARMKSPTGWSEPGQTPEFDEYTVVLRGRRTREPTRYASLGSSRRSDREPLSMSFPNPFSVPN